MSEDEFVSRYGITPFGNTKAREKYFEKIKNNKLAQLLKRPEKEHKRDMIGFTAAPGYHHQADLLFLPTDKGYKYALIVCDIGSRMVDAVPLKQKTQAVVHKAFNLVYKRGILEMPKVLTTDAGTEFGGLKRAFPKVFIRQAPVGRHRYVALAENFNKRIGNAIFIAQYAREMSQNVSNSEWIEDLPKIVKLLNEKQALKNAKTQSKTQSKTQRKQSKKSKTQRKQSWELPGDMFKIGDQVYKKQDYPTDLRGNRLQGQVRAADLAFENKIYKISNVIVQPDKPVYYMLEDVPHVWFNRKQLRNASAESS